MFTSAGFFPCKQFCFLTKKINPTALLSYKMPHSRCGPKEGGKIIQRNPEPFYL